MRRYKVIKTLEFIVVCCVLTGLLNFGLLQYNIARVNVHRITTQKYDDIFVIQRNWPIDGRCDLPQSITTARTR